MRVYLVGGAVRDQLLELPVRERDWVVVGADEEWMLEQGFRRADRDFPVFLHPQSGEEYALARIETKQGEGYRGFRFDTGPHITLEQDLARRDLTINAMAQDEAGEIIDPFGGRNDLDEGRLRHVTPAFAEDPLRILRTARFAARLGRWGFRLAHSTHKLMKQVAASGELKALVAERIWQESRKALADDQPWRYFEVLHRCGALAQLMPEIAAAMADDAGHGNDTSAPMQVLQRASRRSDAAETRLAALLADLLPAGRIPSWCDEQRCERRFREEAEQVAVALAAFGAIASGDAEAAVRLITALRADRNRQRLDEVLAAAGACRPALADPATQALTAALQAWRGIDPAGLQAEGLSGATLGQELLHRRREAVAQALAQAG